MWSSSSLSASSPSLSELCVGHIPHNTTWRMGGRRGGGRGGREGGRERREEGREGGERRGGEDGGERGGREREGGRGGEGGREEGREEWRLSNGSPLHLLYLLLITVILRHHQVSILCHPHLPLGACQVSTGK